MAINNETRGFLTRLLSQMNMTLLRKILFTFPYSIFYLVSMLNICQLSVKSARKDNAGKSHRCITQKVDVLKQSVDSLFCW